jgi:hypothetical protein
MASYTLRADGTAANKAAALDGDPAVVSECMSITTAIGETYSPGDFLYLESANGGDYRTRLDPPSSGDSNSPITIRNYPGHTPILKGSYDLTSATYKWTESPAKAGEYYCELAGGGDPSLGDPDDVFMDDTVLTENDGALGSLADHEWDYGDNDTLGYSTVYVRDDSGNPDVTGVVIEAAQIGTLYINQKNYVVIDGFIFKHAGYRADGQSIGALRMETTSNCTNNTIRNCTATYCGNGMVLKGDYHIMEYCVAEYCRGHSLNIGGEDSRHATYCIIRYSIAHDARLDYGGWDNEYGIKLLFADYCDVHNCETYNAAPAFNLDGDPVDPTYGSNYNNIYYNYIHDAGTVGLHLEWWCHDNNIWGNWIENSGRASDASGVDCDEYRESFAGDNTNPANNNVFNNVMVKTSAGPGDASPDRMVDIGYGTVFYNNTLDGGGIVEYGVVMDGGANPKPKNVKVINNIIDGFKNGCVQYNSSHGEGFDGLDIDYNCCRRSDANANVIQRQYSDMTIATHCSSYSQSCNSINADPQFKDSSNGKYYLQRSSPCRRTGKDLGSTYENALRPGLAKSAWPNFVKTIRQKTGRWNMGAFGDRALKGWKGLRGWTGWSS